MLLVQGFNNFKDAKDCDWYCDICGTHMNYQSGLTTSSDIWNCIECNHQNDVSVSNIIRYGEQPVTDDQLMCIRKVEELFDVTFYGVTLEEASDFIDRYRDLHQAKLHAPFKYR